MTQITLEEAIRSIQNVAYGQNLAMFVGAGISLAPPSDCPNWSDLTANFIEAITKIARPGLPDEDPQLLPQLLQTLYRRPEHTFQVMNEIFGPGPFEGLSMIQAGDPNSNHFLIAGSLWLGMLRAVITTNFDNYIEDAIQFYESVLPSPTQDPFETLLGQRISKPSWDWERARLLWKVHGSLSQPESVVATITATGRGLSEDAAGLFQDILSRHTLLVVGYSANDEDILQVLLDPETIANAKGIIWQVVSEDWMNAGSTVAQLAAAYGNRFKVVVTTGEDLLPSCLEALYFGVSNRLGNAPFEQVIQEQLTQQWDRYCFAAIPFETKRQLFETFDEDAGILDDTGRFYQDWKEPGSVTWRIFVSRMALKMLKVEENQIPDYLDTVNKTIRIYSGELDTLKMSAPLAVLQRYPRHASLLVLSELLLVTHLYDYALIVVNLAEAEIEEAIGRLDSDEPPTPPAQAWTMVTGSTYRALCGEMYRRARAIRAEALLGKDDVNGAIDAASFVYDVIRRGLETGMKLQEWCSSTGCVRAQVVDGRAKLRSGKLDGADGAIRALERANTLDRLYQQLSGTSQITSERSSFTQGYIRAMASQIPWEKLEIKIADALYRSDVHGDSLQSALLVGIHGEYLMLAGDTNRGAEEIEARYEELLHLGAMLETLDLCERASRLLDTPAHSIWESRKTALKEDLLNRFPERFKEELADQLS